MARRLLRFGLLALLALSAYADDDEAAFAEGDDAADAFAAPAAPIPSARLIVDKARAQISVWRDGSTPL